VRWNQRAILKSDGFKSRRVRQLQELPQISEVLVHVEPEEELAAKHIARVN
jgi:hypothetical protein